MAQAAKKDSASATAGKVAERAPKTDGEKKERKSRLKKFKPEQVVKILADKNPKRPGSATHARFELYKNGMTVKEAIDAGIPPGDLDYDNTHEFIKIV
jgi:hypothetical protein